MIECGWLTLRPWRPDDLSFVYDACQDPEIQRWTTVPSPYRAVDAATFLHLAADAARAGTGTWLAIEAIETSELLGSISLKDGAGGRGEIGYWVAAEARGRGVASQALDGLAAWALGELGLDEVWLLVAEGNVASRRAAERAGFVAVERRPGACSVDGSDVDAVVLRRRAPGR